MGNHILKFESVPFNFKLKKISNTNSFHNCLIKKTGRKLITLAKAMDNSIEAFKHSKFKIYGIMWHPERNKKIRDFDIKYFKRFK